MAGSFSYLLEAAATEKVDGPSGDNAIAVDGDPMASFYRAADVYFSITILTGPAAASSPSASFPDFSNGLAIGYPFESFLGTILFISLTFFELATDCSCGTLVNT